MQYVSLEQTNKSQLNSSASVEVFLMSFWPVNKDFYFDVTFMPSSGFMYFRIFPNMRSPAKHFFMCSHCNMSPGFKPYRHTLAVCGRRITL